jgi:hypothetical protein
MTSGRLCLVARRVATMGRKTDHCPRPPGNDYKIRTTARSDESADDQIKD